MKERLVIIILLTIFLIFLATKNLDDSKKDYSIRQKEILAKCLTEKNISMYGVDSCKYCQAQKELFGIAFENVSYIRCSDDPGQCVKIGINKLPSWALNEKIILEGKQTLKNLAEKANCKI